MIIDKIKKLGQEAFLVGLGFAGSTVVVIAGVRVLTSLLPKSEYGLIGLLLSLVNFLSYTFGLSIGSVVARFFVAARDRGEIRFMFRQISVWVVRVVGLIIFLAVLYFLLNLYFQWNYSPLLVVGCTIFSIFVFLNSVALGIENAARLRGISALHQASFDLGRFILAVAAIILLSGSAWAVMFGFALSSFFIVCSHCYFLRRYFSDPANTAASCVKGENTSGSMIDTHFTRYLLPLFVCGAFQWVYLFTDRWFLEDFASLADVGVYFAVYQLSFAPAMLGSSFLVAFLMPIFFQQVSDGANRDNHRKVLMYNFIICGAMFCLVIVGAGVLYFLKGFVSDILLSKDYRSGAWIFPWMFLSGGMFAIGQQLLVSVMSKKSTTSMIPLKIVLAVLAVAIYYFAGKQAGLAGIVFGSVILNAVHLVWAFILTIFVHVSIKEREIDPEIMETS